MNLETCPFLNINRCIEETYEDKWVYISKMFTNEKLVVAVNEDCTVCLKKINYLDTAQIWFLEFVDGYYKIRNLHTKKYLDYNFDKQTMKYMVCVETKHDGLSQRWIRHNDILINFYTFLVLSVDSKDETPYNEKYKQDQRLILRKDTHFYTTNLFNFKCVDTKIDGLLFC